MDVQFDEDNFGRRAPGINPVLDNSNQGSKMEKWLVSAGLAKDISSASKILVSGAIAIFIVSIYFFVFGFSTPDFLGPNEAPASEPVPFNMTEPAL